MRQPEFLFQIAEVLFFVLEAVYGEHYVCFAFAQRIQERFAYFALIAIVGVVIGREKVVGEHCAVGNKAHLVVVRIDIFRNLVVERIKAHACGVKCIAVFCAEFFACIDELVELAALAEHVCRNMHYGFLAVDKVHDRTLNFHGGKGDEFVASIWLEFCKCRVEPDDSCAADVFAVDVFVLELVCDGFRKAQVCHDDLFFDAFALKFVACALVGKEELTFFLAGKWSGFGGGDEESVGVATDVVHWL